jgi:uncharacterized protein (TIRG00374 family)
MTDPTRTRGQQDEDAARPRDGAPAPLDGPEGDGQRQDMPAPVSKRTLLLSLLFIVAALGFLYFVLPQISGLQDTWQRIEDGDPRWLGAALLLEACSFAGYVVLFRTVFVRGESPIGWRESYQITMASLAATRLLATAGAGGVALTAWALRRSGMAPRVVACRIIAQLALLYAVFMGALVLAGLGLYLGVLSGSAPFAITIVPAIFAAVAIALALAISRLPEGVERYVQRRAQGSGRLARFAARLATAPAALAQGFRTGMAVLRSGQLGVLGAVAWWGFDVLVLWASFRAFGEAPPLGVVVMGYFVGMLGNLLPLPGGVGGVDGGMIGAFLAFGVPGGLAVVAVLTYRAFAFWLPTLPGAVAYLQLRRTVRDWSRGHVTA